MTCASCHGRLLLEDARHPPNGDGCRRCDGKLRWRDRAGGGAGAESRDARRPALNSWTRSRTARDNKGLRQDTNMHQTTRKQRREAKGATDTLAPSRCDISAPTPPCDASLLKHPATLDPHAPGLSLCTPRDDPGRHTAPSTGAPTDVYTFVWPDSSVHFS